MFSKKGITPGPSNVAPCTALTFVMIAFVLMTLAFNPTLNPFAFEYTTTTTTTDTHTTPIYDDGYDSGYDNGYDLGLLAGNSSGYDFGFLVGNDTGYIDGYIDGFFDGYDEGSASVQCDIALNIPTNFPVTVRNNMSLLGGAFVQEITCVSNTSSVTTQISSTESCWQSLFIPRSGNLTEIRMMGIAIGGGSVSNMTYAVYTAYYDTGANVYKPNILYSTGTVKRLFNPSQWKLFIFSGINHLLNISQTNGNMFFIKYLVQGTATFRPTYCTCCSNTIDYRNNLLTVPSNGDFETKYTLMLYSGVSQQIENDSAIINLVSLGNNGTITDILHTTSNLQYVDFYNYSYGAQLNGDTYNKTFMSNVNLPFNRFQLIGSVSYLTALLFTLQLITENLYNGTQFYTFEMHKSYNITISNISISINAPASTYYIRTWKANISLAMTINNTVYAVLEKSLAFDYLF